MDFKHSKNLGGVGALLIVLGVIPTFVRVSDYGILRVAGIILILLGLMHFSNIYQAKNIFSNAKIGAFIAIIYTVILGPVLDIVTSKFLQNIALESITGALVIQVFLMVFVILAIFGVTFTISSFYVKRSLKELAVYSGVSDFESAGEMLYLGAKLSIIAVGVIIMGLAFIRIAYTFFNMNELKAVSLSTASTTDTKHSFCPNCGTPILHNAAFCIKCGKANITSH
ncbi:MAG: DUF996 domain-containing protein [Nitrososphaerota archaeon]|nr:DUF996 domain-containing protein [Nitrososphaerota archaeon]